MGCPYMLKHCQGLNDDDYKQTKECVPSVQFLLGKDTDESYLFFVEVRRFILNAEQKIKRGLKLYTNLCNGFVKQTGYKSNITQF